MARTKRHNNKNHHKSNRHKPQQNHTRIEYNRITQQNIQLRTPKVLRKDTVPATIEAKTENSQHQTIRI